ncbi:MAG: hypothetical protein ACI4WH_00185 [Oscillospiraceae bacterium]
MIFKLSAKQNTDTNNFYISTDGEILKYNIENDTELVSSGKFTKFDKSYQRLTKDYQTSEGKTITYGIRSRYTTIDFTIECLENDYQHILKVLNITYEYYVTENFPNIPIVMKLSSDLKETKICNNYQNGEALYTLSGKLVEV